jgi:EAL domain-containing protein (putative c-di-GMP-specific phosphodiesterase class I)
VGIKGLSKFIKKVEKIKKFTDKEFEKTLQDIARETNQQLINFTRYISGTARNSWEATIGSPTNLSPDILPPPTANSSPVIQTITRLAIQKNNRVIATWDGEKALFLASNLHYIKELEEGGKTIRRANHMVFKTEQVMEPYIKEQLALLERKINLIWNS